MSRARILFLLPVFLCAGLAARADTISTFHFTGSSIFLGLGGDQNTVSGTATIDVTTGVAEEVSFIAGGVSQTAVVSQQGPIVFVGSAPSKLSFDAGSLINFTGGAFDLNGPNDLYVGHVTVDPVALTPEPSSIFLLGSGLVGMAGLLRRRLALRDVRGS